MVAVGTVDDNNNVWLECSNNEYELVYQFWSRLRREHESAIKNKEQLRLVGFNSFNFDLPFMEARAIKHNVPIVKEAKESFSLDMRQRLGNGHDSSRGTLCDYAGLINRCLTKYNGMIGAEVPQLWYAYTALDELAQASGVTKNNVALLKQAIVDKVKKYLEQDLAMTKEIYEHYAGLGLW